MTTTKSYSDRSRFAALYRTSLRRQIPFGIVTLILMFLTVLLPYLVETVLYNNDYYNVLARTPDNFVNIRGRFTGIYLTEELSVLVLVLLMAITLVVALVQNAYMHSKKTTDLYHALPVRRRSLLTANFLSGMTAILVPFLAVYLVTFVTQMVMYGQFLSGYAPYFQYIGIDLFCAVVTVIVIYLFTTFIAVNVGTVFDSFAVTCVLGTLPLVVYLVVAAIWASLTYGASSMMMESALVLSPFTFMFQRYVYMGLYRSALANMSMYGKTALVLAVWLVIAALLYLAAIQLYNRRKSEIAEQTQPSGILQILTKCYVAFCGSALFFAIFYETGSTVARMVAALAGALIIGLIAELILSRGVRALRRNLKWMAGAWAVFLLIFIGTSVDFTGYAARVPDPASVEYVVLNYQGRFTAISSSNYYFGDGEFGYNRYALRDPASIEAVTTAHRLAVDNRPAEDGYIVYDENGERTHGYYWLSIDYKLKNGRTVSRQYSTMYIPAIRALADLEDKNEFIEANYALFNLEGYARDLGLSGAADMVDTVTLYNAYGSQGKPHKLSQADAARLLEAARADILAQPLQDILEPSDSALGYMDILYQYNLDQFDKYYATDTVVIGKNFKNTTGVLESLGLLDEMTETPPVDTVYLMPATYYLNEDIGVQTLLPETSPAAVGWVIDGVSADLYELSDAGAVRSVQSVARNQLLQKSYAVEDSLLLALYESGGERCGAQLVRVGDLPQDIRRDIEDAYVEEGDLVYGYPIFEDERHLYQDTYTDVETAYEEEIVYSVSVY